MLIPTHEITPNTHFDDSTNLQVYCALDSMLTHEVRTAEQRFGPEPAIYTFERALQGPYLDVMELGFLVDEFSRQQAVSELKSRISYVQEFLNELSFAIWDRPLNPRSPQQLKSLFYEHLKLPEQHRNDHGVRKVTTNREALENLEIYLYARPIIGCILRIRDLDKQREIFETEIDPDSRIRTSYNIAGTETGRPSSSSNAFGTGGNLQNIPSSLRYVFIADKGKKICQIDREQSEARDVGWLCGVTVGDWSFLDACESGPLHVNNCRLIWPELSWTGDYNKDRTIADQTFYREYTYYDFAKRAGHLSHYMGTAWTASRVLKVPQSYMDNFHQRYILGPKCAYPCIPKWWQWTIEQIQTKSILTTPFGRTRQFFGRPNDPATWRESIAFMPQSMTADGTSLGFWRVHRHMQRGGKRQVQLLAETYDSIAFQYPEELEDEIVPEAIHHMLVEMPIVNGRKYTVPVEAKVGWNWGNICTADDIKDDIKAGRKPRRLNADGLKKWIPGRPDERKRTSIPGQFGTRLLT